MYVNAAALLGTNLSADRVAEIRATKLSPVYLALDKDAFPIAVKYVVEYRAELPLKLLTLKKDLKNLTEDELYELLSEHGLVS